MLKNKKKIYGLIFLAYLVSVTCYCYAGDNKKEVIAVVGSYEIKLTDFTDRYSEYLLVSDTKDNLVIRKAVLNNMINEIILHYYDDNTNIYSSQEFIKETEWNKKQAILGYLKDREVYAKINVTDKELRETFLKVNEKIAARHLFAETEKEAYKLYDLLMIGKTFNELAQTVFSDSVLKNNGGYLGYFTWGDMDPAFEEAAYSLNKGAISRPIKTTHGYSIIKIEDKVRIPLLTENEFINKKNHLSRILKIKKKKPAENEFINNLFNRESLKINLEVLNTIIETNTINGKFNWEKSAESYKEKPCVIYKNKEYSLSDIEKKLSEIPSYHLIKINTLKDLSSTVESVFIQEELLSVAYSKGYDSVIAVENVIEKLQNNSFLKFKKEEIMGKTVIPDSLINEYYKNNLHRFSAPKMLNLQEILVDTKELADSLMQLLQKGESFGNLAQKFSLRKWTAENDGKFGLTPLDKFGFLKDRFWNSEINSLVGPIPIENTYGIFKILEKVEKQTLDLNTIKYEVVWELKSEMSANLLTDYLNIIRTKVKININEELVNSYQFSL